MASIAFMMWQPFCFGFLEKEMEVKKENEELLTSLFVLFIKS